MIEKGSAELLRVTVDYFRKPNRLMDENSGSVYTEQLIVDRERSCAEIIRNLGNGKVLSQKLSSPNVADVLLSHINLDEICADEPPKAEVDSSAEYPTYKLTACLNDGRYYVLQGVYRKSDLPKFWERFMLDAHFCLNYYGRGDMLDPDVFYGTDDTEDGEFIYCSVEFSEGGRSYYYIAEEEDDIKVGDCVIVPVGSGTRTSAATVIKVERFDERNAPFPLSQTKYIIEKFEKEPDLPENPDEVN